MICQENNNVKLFPAGLYLMIYINDVKFEQIYDERKTEISNFNKLFSKSQCKCYFEKTKNLIDKKICISELIKFCKKTTISIVKYTTPSGSDPKSDPNTGKYFIQYGGVAASSKKKLKKETLYDLLSVSIL
jgi:hypothetical protein